MKKYTLIILFFIFLILPVSVLAQVVPDFSVECGDSGCDPSDVPSFMPSVFWYPGLTVAKLIRVKNVSSENKQFGIRTDNVVTNGIIDQIISHQIIEGGSTLWNGTLSQLYSFGEMYLTDIAPSVSKNFSFTYSMPLTADNQYSNQSTKFDLVMGFIGPTPTPTLTLTPTPTVTPTETPGPTETPAPAPSQTPTPTPQGTGGAYVQVIITTVINQTTVDINQGETPTPTGSVLGGNTGTTLAGGAFCKNSWWWPLVVLTQIYLMALLIKNARKETVLPTLAGNLIISSLAIYTILQILCFWTYAMLPFCVGVIGFYLLYKKIIISFAGSKLLYS